MNETLDIESGSRGMTFTDTAFAPDQEIFPVVCSTDSPVEMEHNGMRYSEVLDHSPECADLSFFNRGAPVFVDHKSADWPGGIVPGSARLDGGKLRGDIRFSSSPRGREIRLDVINKVRGMVSLGYRHKVPLVREMNDGVAVYRSRSWRAEEVSIVSIPRDEKAGIGRSKSANLNSDQTMNPTPETITAPAVSPLATTPPATLQVTEPVGGDAAFRKRSKEILAIGAHFNCSAKAAEFIDSPEIDKPDAIRAFAALVTAGKRNAPLREGGADIGMSDGEAKEFNILRAIRGVMSGKFGGFEREVSDAALQREGRELGANMFHVPYDVMKRGSVGAPMRRAMTAGVNTEGGYTIQTDVGGLIPKLQNAMVTYQAGVGYMGGLVNNQSLPVETDVPSASWLAENGEIDLTDIAFGDFKISPKRLGDACAFSRQLLIQSTEDINSLVNTRLMESMARRLDLTVYTGTGTSNQPLGIANWTGKATDVTFGGAPTWESVVAFETNINAANANIGGMGFIMQSSVIGKWKTTVKSGNTAGIFLIEQNQANGYPFYMTNQLTDGKVYFGNWPSVKICQWGGFDITVDNLTLARVGKTLIVIQGFFDIALLQPKAICMSSDSGAQ